MLILVVVAVLLFLLAFATKRRFGILGLALFSGSFLAQSWSGVATSYVEQTGINFSALWLPASALVAALLTILPALILLANSPKYHGKWVNVFGALGFSILAVILLVPILATAFAVEPGSQSIISFFQTNVTLLVTVGIICAIVDLLLSRSSHKPKKGREAKH